MSDFPIYGTDFPIYGTIGPYQNTVHYVEPTYTTVRMDELPGACPWCSTPWSASFHGGRCPKVKAKEYHENGTLKRIEFFPEP